MFDHYPNIRFTRIGHFSIDDNIRTNYQVRELKTVNLETYCQYLKIVLSHQNNFNIFNQLGYLMGENKFGKISQQNLATINRGSSGRNGIASQKGGLAFQGDFFQDANFVPRNMRIYKVNEDGLDPSILDKLKALNSAKQKAVKQEDFDKTKNLKEVIDKLKMAVSQQIKFKMQKKNDIQSDDFDTAKVLKYLNYLTKYDINRLKAMAKTLENDGVNLFITRCNINTQTINKSWWTSINGK